MWKVLLYTLILILAFVFVVLTSATVDEESAAIGTLLALGYRKSEILCHYLALPLTAGIVGAVLGNTLGYAFLIERMSGLYYNSYSLPPYHTSWNWDVFIQSTLLPLAILAVVSLVGLVRRLRCTPLQFLRYETNRRNRKGGKRLPEFLSFSSRFRLRVLERNISHFATLFVGIIFTSLLLLFGFCMMPTVERYASSLEKSLVSDHCYTLKTPIELEGTDEEREMYAAALELADNVDMSTIDEDDIDFDSFDFSNMSLEDLGLENADIGELTFNEFFSLLQKASRIDEEHNIVNTQKNSQEAIDQAEKFVAANLEYARGSDAGWESVVLYGIQKDSRYYDDLPLSEGTVVIGRGLALKFDLEVGDAIQLYDKYENKNYDFVVGSVWGSDGAMNVYLPFDKANIVLGNDADFFSGYLSDQELNIDQRYIVNDLTSDQMDKISAQMEDSMGDMMFVLMGVATAIYTVLMYLLTKIVIERSARSISCLKVFGYTNIEIAKLYLLSIAEVAVVSLVAAIPVVVEVMTLLVQYVFMRYDGNFVIALPPERLALELALGIACFVVVAFFHMRRINRVSLALALKMQE